MICYNCEGTGKIAVMGQSDNMDLSESECSVCGGTGKAPVEREDLINALRDLVAAAEAIEQEANNRLDRMPEPHRRGVSPSIEWEKISRLASAVERAKELL